MDDYKFWLDIIKGGGGATDRWRLGVAETKILNYILIKNQILTLNWTELTLYTYIAKWCT
jgi:hypothetical protein